ncbi:hypothetical protein SAMN02745229_03113 [Butyrivibrio fibrisolvens DSM 3071]|jgi:hypothetical protein|uniref:Uncharacterized protein n=2 Tax=Butyrivibrio fibrisolvens TaxID=831 RepID=A0A1M6BAR4_BUTFI|nr:hypothetical protein [Butyrivibrio fibrisolvens]SHI45841.1 hypothetical protein SAMN02745229_03113 [Butyrivibrio fibrisolvens DSM 3071]
MGMNPANIMKLMQRLNIFRTQHPKFQAFLGSVTQGAIREGTIIEIKVTDPDGGEYISNMKLTSDDIETVEILKNIRE